MAVDGLELAQEDGVWISQEAFSTEVKELDVRIRVSQTPRAGGEAKSSSL
jgi:hypothetical protein